MNLDFVALLVNKAMLISNFEVQKVNCEGGSGCRFHTWMDMFLSPCTSKLH